MKTFSIIIPHRDSIESLSRLIGSIPNDDNLEIIIVDNSLTPITKTDIGVDRLYSLLYSKPQAGAGGARNVGIDNAQGKWLIFADADDYFITDAFDLFNSYKNSDADLIYTCMGGVYIDTGKPSDRGDTYTSMIRQYLKGEIPETDLRYKFSSPCCKMVRHDMVRKFHLRYDEVTASNDMYFSMLCGYYAKKIVAVDVVTYIATVSKGTLTKRRDFAVISARFVVNLRYNRFMKEHGLPEYQRSIMYFALVLCKMGVKQCFDVLKLLIKYKQNPFVGYHNWLKTICLKKKKDKKDKDYIVK